MSKNKKEKEAIDWSLKSWKERHDNGYFPNSEQHMNWRVYASPPDWLIEHGKPTQNDDVLEIGCGYGEWMIPLSGMVKSVSGFDTHESPGSVANRKFSELGIKNCVWKLGEGTTVPFEDGSFSMVYSISVFQHLPRAIVRGYIKESARVLKKDGRCLHHFRNADNIGPYPKPADDISANHTGDFSVGWTEKEVREAMSEHFNIVSVHDIGLFLIAIATQPKNKAVTE